MEISGNLLHESSVSRMNLVALLKKKKTFVLETERSVLLKS